MGRPLSEECGDEYRKALELAATSRYREARDKLRGILDDHPDYAEALILLGRVEYYLRRSASSRRCFETALVYEPGNSAAWFGLQFYRERQRSVIIGVAVACLLLSIILTAAGVYLGLVAQFDRRFGGELATLKTTFTGRLTDLAAAEERNAELIQRIGTMIDNRFDKITVDMQTNADALESYRLDSNNNAASLAGRLREITVVQEANRDSLGRLEETVGELSARLAAEEQSPKQPSAASRTLDMTDLNVD